MGKHNNKTSLGRTLIKSRFGGSRNRKFVRDQNMLHTTEIKDGYDWGRLNLQSVTEESSFQEFLSTAELAGTEFEAEKMNIKFVNPKISVGLLSAEETKQIKIVHDKHKDVIKIPRRPKWDSNTTPEELTQLEKEQFLEWRRSLADLQEEEGCLLTPFEKNLEFWRQLWRVVERSDVVVQIVDGRNPLLFRCEDLELYVKEVNENKMNLILINKADFLTDEQRVAWAKYFDTIGVSVVFFSAIDAQDEVLNEIKEEEVEDADSAEETSAEIHKEIKEEVEVVDSTEETSVAVAEIRKDLHALEVAVSESEKQLESITEKITPAALNEQNASKAQVRTNSSAILSRLELVEFFKVYYEGPKINKDLTTIGLVGYPNVGKSSTINALLQAKKVSVSATPGKTKHFQTLYLDKEVLLCDCPGLVMPSFVYTKAEMIINGILPIDQMRDHVPPINLVSSLIPRYIFEDKYGLMLPQPMESEDPNRSPTSEELLNAHAYNRGFMTANGQPDNPRSARYVLKDFVNGKLLYAHAPPGIEQAEYHIWPEQQRKLNERKTIPPRELRAIKVNITEQDVMKNYFENESKGHHVKGVVCIPSGSHPSATVVGAKPWKTANKHANKNKREKSRRLYSHLDQH